MIDECSQELPKPSGRQFLSITEALLRIKQLIQPISDLETVELGQGLNRILSEPVYSPIDIPYERNSAMDGYAFASRDVIAGSAFTLTEAGTAWAGRPFAGELQPGECIRIFTGAVVPSEADSVVMQEQVEKSGSQIHFPVTTGLTQNIRAAGEDVKQGALLIAAPKMITAADIGLLASAGVPKIQIKRKLRIAFFSTGDELVGLGEELSSGKIYDSNRYSLAALLDNKCWEAEDLGVLPDRRDALKSSFLAAAKHYDVIISTGGASVGDADYVKEILAEYGQVEFWKIAMKPGKPLAFGTIGGCYFFGLPGNPVAVLATFQQIVRPALGRLGGAPEVKPIRVQAVLLNRLKKTPGREEFQRGLLTQDESGRFFVSAFSRQGSHILSTISQANCYLILPKDCAGVEIGEMVNVEPFERFI